jgi:hypothetical protein
MRIVSAVWTIALCFAPIVAVVFGMNPASALVLLCADMIVVSAINGARHITAASRPDISPLALWPLIAFVMTGMVCVMAMWLDPAGPILSFDEMLTQSEIGGALILLTWGRLLQFGLFLATPEARRSPQLIFNPLIVVACLLWVLRPGAIPISIALLLLCIGNAAFELLVRKVEGADPREQTWLHRVQARLVRGR